MAKDKKLIDRIKATASRFKKAKPVAPPPPLSQCSFTIGVLLKDEDFPPHLKELAATLAQVWGTATDRWWSERSEEERIMRMEKHA